MSIFGIKIEDLTKDQWRDINHFIDLDSVQFRHCKNRKRCANGRSWQPEYEFDARTRDGVPFNHKLCKSCRRKILQNGGRVLGYFD